MAECLLTLGDPARANRMLDFLHGLPEQRGSTKPSQHLLQLSPRISKALHNNTSAHVWASVIAASLYDDTEAQLKACESLKNAGHPWATVLSIFLCLQADCPRRSLSEIEIARSSKSLSDPIALLLLYLYEIDGLMSTNESTGRILQVIRSRMSSVVSAFHELNIPSTVDQQSAAEFRATLLNNHALVDLIVCQNDGALSHFGDACKSMDCIGGSDQFNLNVLPHFNLSLLTLSDITAQTIQAAMEGWICARCLGDRANASMMKVTFDEREKMYKTLGASCIDGWKWRPFDHATDRVAFLMDLIQLQVALQLSNETNGSLLSILDLDMP
jgi:hypothetical protein